MGIDWNTDTFQGAGLRLNVWGSEKLTHQLGQDLQELYSLPDRRNDVTIAPIWNQALDTYKQKQELYELTQIADLDSYLEALQPYAGRYEIVVAYKRGGTSLTDSQLAGLETIGFHPISHDGDLFSYLGIYDRTGLVYEESSSEKILRHENSPYTNLLVQIEGSQIFINQSNYTRLAEGLGIVVYDRQERQLIDAVGCDPAHPDVLHRGSYSSDAFTIPAGVP